MNRFLIVASTLLLSLSACRSGFKEAESGSELVPVHAVFSAAQCLRSEPMIELLRDRVSLKEWWEPLSKQVIPTRKLPGKLADVDFATEIVLVMSMGQQPTTGYQIELSNESAMLQDVSLTVTTNWWQPPEDMNVAQIMTSPCLAVTLPAGRYETVSVMDERADLRVVKHFQ